MDAGCPKCSHRAPLSQAEAAARFKMRGFEMLEPYIPGTATERPPTLVRCLICNHKDKKRLDKGGCRKCAKQLPISQVEAGARFHVKGLRMLEPFKKSDMPVLVECLKCGLRRRTLAHGGSCPKCSGRFPLTNKEAVARFRARGFEMLESYKSGRPLILTRCLKCSYEWKVRSQNIFRGSQCPKCCGQAPVSNAEFTDRCKLKNLEVLETFQNVNAKILVKCKTCGYKRRVFPSSVNNLIKGCPCCADYGFQPDKPAILYYIRVETFDANPLYKIGVTNRTLRKRFPRDFDNKITILETVKFEVGAEAFKMEQEVLKEYEQYRYDGPDILNSNGNDELFTLDVLGLDKGARQFELA